MSLTAIFSVLSGFTWRLLFQSGQEVPAMPAHGFEVRKAAVPAVKADVLGTKLTRLCRREHRKKMIVLRDLSFALLPQVRRGDSRRADC